MDHPSGVIATMPPARTRSLRDRLGRYWLDGPDGRHVYDGGVALSPEAQREEELLNCALYVEEYAAGDDPWQAAQRLRARLRGRPLPAAEIDVRRFWPNEPAPPAGTPSAVGDVMSILSHGPSVVTGAYRIAVRRRPPLIRARRVIVICMSEQVPDPASRVTLSDRRDHLGVGMPRIDWRISDAELRSVRRLEELFGAALARVGEPRPVAEPWLNDESWRAAMTDRVHPIGTTRMADDPRKGVVDRDCAVHGVHGLYVAGSSTFPTSGRINPTLTIVALSIRLADHLKHELLRSHSLGHSASRA